MDENTILDPLSGDTGNVGDTGDTGITDTGIEVTNNDEVPVTDTGDSSSGTVADGGDTIVNVVSDGDVVSRVVTVDPYVIEDGNSSLLALVNSVFGDYQPRTQTVTEVYSDGSTVTYTEVVDGLAGLDFYWLGGVLVFCIVLWSFFKFLGGIFKVR